MMSTLTQEMNLILILEQLKKAFFSFHFLFLEQILPLATEIRPPKKYFFLYINVATSGKFSGVSSQIKQLIFHLFWLFFFTTK